MKPVEQKTKSISKKSSKQIVSSFLPSQAIDLLKGCFPAAKGLSLVPLRTSNTVTVTAEWTDPTSGNTPYAIVRKFQPSGGVTCDASNLQPGAKLGKVSVVCSTSGDSEPAVFVLNADVGSAVATLAKPTRMPPSVTGQFKLEDQQPHTYSFAFATIKDNEKVWITINNPCGGTLDGRNYDFFVSKQRREAQIPSIPGCTVYAFGKVSLETGFSDGKVYVFFTGGFVAGDGTQIYVQDAAVGSASAP